MKYLLVVIVLLLFFNSAALGQCSPTVIFKEDFKTGTRAYGDSLGNNITAYAFDSTGSLADGEYTIRKTASPLDGTFIYPTWHTGYEHTGNGGYMMVVNAAFQSGKFYEAKIDNLCSGSSMKFSAWVANLLRLGSPDPLDPDVKFEIKSASSGNILGTYTTGKINRYPSFTWEQYGFNILLPANETSVILTMYNNQVGGGGNDLVLDDIEFAICGAGTKPFIVGAYQNNNTVCSGNPITFRGNISSVFYTNPVRQWQYSSDSINWVNITGAVNEDYTISNTTPADSKWYRLLIAEPSSINLPNCRTTSPVIRLNVFDPKPVSINHKNVYCVDDSIVLINQFNALRYQWSGPNGFTSTDDTIIIYPATLNDTGTYTLQTITDGGCVTNGQTNVSVITNQLSVDLPDTTVLLCDGQDITFIADNPFITKWEWSNGGRTNSITVKNPDIYSVVVSDIACFAYDTTVVRTNRSPFIKFGKDTTICSDENIVLNIFDPVATSYLWQDNATDTVRIITQQNLYRAVLSNECGTVSDDIFIKVENCLNQLFVPTAFTPNNDNKNDVLKAKAWFPITDFSFSIYNRWGQKVFSTPDLNSGWDGTLNGTDMPAGTYVWHLSYKRKEVLYKQKGSTILIR